jgi:hypothetical protein
MNILNEKYRLGSLIIIYKILLEISYVLFVHPLFKYMGFTYDFSLIKVIESYLTTLFLLLWLPTNEKKPSTIMLNILYLIMIIPIFSLYFLKNESRLYFYAVFVSFCITLIMIKILPNITVKSFRGSRKCLFFILSGITIFVYGILICFNGIPNLNALDFTKIYEIRSEVNYGLGIMGYLGRWQARVINIFIIWVGWHKRNKKIFTIGIVLQLLIFLITAHKTYFFIPIMLVFLMYFINKKRLIKLCIIGLIIILLGSLLLAIFDITIRPASLFTRRTLFLPAQLNFQYYDYFSQHSFSYLSHSVLEIFWKKPIYADPAPRIIGWIYYERETWANTGYLGDAYYNFGIVGMLMFSVIFVFVLKTVDSLSNTQEKKLLSGVMLGTASISFINGAFLTTLLTGGVLFYMGILWLYQEKNNCNKSNYLRNERQKR